MSYSTLIRSTGPLRQRDIDRHDVTADDFVERCRQAGLLAANSGAAGVAEFVPQLLERIADFRNLKVAWDHVANNQDAAPGPDGKRSQDYGADEAHRLLAKMGDAIRTEQLRAGPERIVHVPKGPGREGTRPLSLLNIPDRVAQRGTVQMIQPLLDPQFDGHSFGGRPGRSSWQALARACVVTEREGRRFWVAADLADYFTTIPLGRLWPVVRRYLPSDELIGLLRRLMQRDQSRGLAQGAPLSTLLANIYAHHFLDRPWRRQLTTVPLLRFIDDLLIIAASAEEAGRAYELLPRLVKDAGLKFKATEQPIRDLAAGEHVDWLGYRITFRGDRVRFALPPGKLTDEPCGALLDQLRVSLELTHEKPDSALRAIQVIEGMVDHAGPCWPSMTRVDGQRLYARMVEVAIELGFEELPVYRTFTDRWRAAYERWRRVRRKVDPPAR